MVPGLCPNRTTRIQRLRIRATRCSMTLHDNCQSASARSPPITRVGRSFGQLDGAVAHEKQNLVATLINILKR
ncbi:hypothetical protein M3J09_013715 [Ascochyta lentis]